MDKNEIVLYLSMLNKRLSDNEQQADILIAGGASMAFLIDDARVTHDIDAVVLSGEMKNAVARYVEEISYNNELPKDWFNEAVKGFIDLSWERKDLHLGFSNLGVFSVPPEQLLAMKLSSARHDTRDFEDSRNLMNYLQISSEEDALKILEDNIPSRVLTAKMQYFTQAVFEDYYECCLYTLDEIYERAEDKPHLSPELKAKDEALWEIAEYIEQESGENPYKLQSANQIDSAEEYIDAYLEEHNLDPRFNDRGSIITMGERKMDVKELNRDQINELKARIITDRLDERGETPSYGELANADQLVSDEEVFAEYEGVSFSEDDFFCSFHVESEEEADTEEEIEM